MENYDVFIAGGGIAGSVAAMFLARHGLNSVFIEKERTPRHKACSGIQFKYLQKIIGEKIPLEGLCTHQISKVKMIFPNGKSIGTRLPMLNFMRNSLDSWLNGEAVAAGARFQDECKMTGLEEVDGGFVVTTKSKDGQENKCWAKYVVDASGLNPVIRKKMRPSEFSKDTVATTVNYYIDGDANMKPDTLYQFWNVDWNDIMFAWAYTKTLDDGNDYWVVGTGCSDGTLKVRQQKFYDHLASTFGMKGDVVKKEGFATTINMYSRDRIWLGQGNILFTGDAAGLVDQVRGLGMDSAAISGRFAAKAIHDAELGNKPVQEIYARLMNNVVSQTRQNQEREISRFSSNKELQRHLIKNVVPRGLGLFMQNALNVFRPVERLVLLPP